MRHEDGDHEKMLMPISTSKTNFAASTVDEDDDVCSRWYKILTT